MNNSLKPVVLVVEDDPLIRDFEVATLKRAGYEVLSAEDGIEGGSVFARYFQEIDLMVTDISMPGMDGLKLASFVRNIRQDLHIVFASGSIEANHQEFRERFSDSVLIPKPLTAAELLAAVSKGISHNRLSVVAGAACERV
jgi:CheY-like chemotaxis protein